MNPIKHILGYDVSKNRKKVPRKEQAKIHCFECGQMIPEENWLQNPKDNYGCSRHL
jgi:ribosomal protein S26